VACQRVFLGLGTATLTFLLFSIARFCCVIRKLPFELHVFCLFLGTEEETKAFMAICIETVKAQDPADVRTPVFVFERLCSIIYPEENDTGEFFLTLDKDPQQEDFLQVFTFFHTVYLLGFLPLLISTCSQKI